MASVSRTTVNAKSDPLYMLTPKFNSGCRSIVSSLFTYIRTNPSLRDVFWCGRGWDSSGSIEHGSGRAVDIIVTERTGMMRNAKEFTAAKAVIDLLIKHGRALKIQWILFSLDGKVTWSYNMDRGTWKKLAYRSSGNVFSANHIDHIHLYFKVGATLPAGFDFGGSKLKTIYTSHVRKAAQLDPPKPNSNRGVYGAEVLVVEQMLHSEGLLASRYVDGHFGSTAVTAYSEWQQFLGYEGTEPGGDADGVPGFESLSKLGKRHGVTVIDA